MMLLLCDRKPPVCETCGWEIDPECCWCGMPMDKHTEYDGHSPIPMGCTCGYNDAEKRKNPDYRR